MENSLYLPAHRRVAEEKKLREKAGAELKQSIS